MCVLLKDVNGIQKKKQSKTNGHKQIKLLAASREKFLTGLWRWWGGREVCGGGWSTPRGFKVQLNMRWLMWVNSAWKGQALGDKCGTLVNISAHRLLQILFICLFLSPVDRRHSWAAPPPPQSRHCIKAEINSLVWYKVHLPAEPLVTLVWSLCFNSRSFRPRDSKVPSRTLRVPG